MIRPGKCEGCGQMTTTKQVDPCREELYGEKKWIYLHNNEACVRVLTDEI